MLSFIRFFFFFVIFNKYFRGPTRDTPPNIMRYMKIFQGKTEKNIWLMTVVLMKADK